MEAAVPLINFGMQYLAFVKIVQQIVQLAPAVRHVLLAIRDI